MDRLSNASLAAVADALRPPGFEGAPWLNVARAMHRVRIGVGLSALGLPWLLPGATSRQRVAFFAMVAGIYLPWAALTWALARRHETPLIRVSAIAGDLLIVFLFQLLLPPTRFVGVIGYLLLVAIHASIGGVVPGLALTGAGAGLTLAAQSLGSNGVRVDLYTLSMFSAASVGLTVMLDSSLREQRNALRGLAEGRRQLAEAQSLARLGSWYWDVARDRVTWSDELYRIYGLDPESFRATYEGFLECVHPDDRSMVDGTVRRSFTTGEPFEFDHRIVRPDGSVRWLRGRGQTLRDPSGGTIAMSGTGQEITVQKEAETALQEAYALEREAAARLREAEELRTEFLSGVSHDLRGPVAAILGLASTLLQTGATFDERQKRDFMERIERNAADLQHLIDQLMEYAQWHWGRHEIRPVRLPLERWVVSFLQTRGPVFASHVVAIDVPDDIVVLAEPQLLGRIIGNLLNNAVKFSPTGSTVTISARERADSVVIAVADEGVGIAKEEVGSLFRPFHQGPEGKAGLGGTGMGMGLAIAKRCTELLGGEIWVESEPGLGSTFFVRLPLPSEA